MRGVSCVESLLDNVEARQHILWVVTVQMNRANEVVVNTIEYSGNTGILQEEYS